MAKMTHEEYKRMVEMELWDDLDTVVKEINMDNPHEMIEEVFTILVDKVAKLAADLYSIKIEY